MTSTPPNAPDNPSRRRSAKPSNKAPACQVCGATARSRELIRAALIRPSVVREIRSTGLTWDPEGYICRPDLNEFRSRYIHSLLSHGRGELSNLEREVIESLREHEVLARDVDTEFEGALSFGERASDALADFGGSWSFIGLFALVMLGWIAVNSWLLLSHAFDPYPYILLNLMLSCLAALQAPVIMMSQNRQEARDRLRAQSDYRVNLKAELEIRQLHEKIDHLISNQWDRLMEIQDIQVEIMSELAEAGKRA